MKIPDHLGTSGLQFGMVIDQLFDGDPLKASDIFPAICWYTGDAIPPRYYAEMIWECKLMELRGRELWAEPSWCDDMLLHCEDVGEKIAYWYYKELNQWKRSSY